METHVENVIRTYFFDHRAVAFEGADFVQFEGFGWVRTVNTSNEASKLIAGRIVYQKPSASEHSYKNLLIRYSEEVTDTPLLGLLQPLSRELRLWQTPLPLLNYYRPIMHLFLELRVGCATATPPPPYRHRTSMRYAVVWELPAHFVPFAQISSATFDYWRCLLMVRAIATFHASSFCLHINDGAMFENIHAMFESYPLHLLLDPLVPTLRRCLEPLRNDPPYLCPDGPIQAGVARLQKILDAFETHVRAAFVRDPTNDQYWVMCHRNYGRHSVVFESDPAGKPAQVRIFNCYSMGFASVGVDLAIVLLVELSAAHRNQHYNQLVSDYCAQLLQKTIDEIEEYTLQTVHREVVKSIPYALYVLAGRIVDAQAETQPGTAYFQADYWTEDLLTNVYHYLIKTGIVWQIGLSVPTSSANQ